MHAPIRILKIPCLHDSRADVVVHDVEAEVAGAAPPHQHLSTVRVVAAGAASDRSSVETCIRNNMDDPLR